MDDVELEALCERSRKTARLVAWRLTGRQRDAAEDLVQEAFRKLLMALTDPAHDVPLADEARFARYLCQVVHNTFVDGYRRQRRVVVEDLAERAEPAAPEPSPLQSLIEREGRWGRGAPVRALLQGLPSHYRQTLECWLAGLSVKQTSQRLQLEPETVRKQRARGKRVFLKAYLEWRAVHP